VDHHPIDIGDSNRTCRVDVWGAGGAGSAGGTGGAGGAGGTGGAGGAGGVGGAGGTGGAGGAGGLRLGLSLVQTVRRPRQNSLIDLFTNREKSRLCE